MVIIILPHALVLPRKLPLMDVPPVPHPCTPKFLGLHVHTMICKDNVAMLTRLLNKFIVLMRGLVLMQILLRVTNSAAMLILLGVH